MYHSITKFGFQRIVSLLLLVTFVPLVVLSEAGHLISGVSGQCNCFRAVSGDSLHDTNVACSHDHGFSNYDEAEGIGARYIGVDGNDGDDFGECVLHIFCSSFNSFGIVITFPFISKIISCFYGIELLFLSGEFYSHIQARAPPLFFLW